MKTNSINNRTEILRAKREELKSLSAPFKALLKSGAIHTVNEGLKNMYAEEGHTELKTLKQWNKQGYRVKKGEKALLLWGSPVSAPKQEDSENVESDEESKNDYFPICFVFSQNQVQQN